MSARDHISRTVATTATSTKQPRHLHLLHVTSLLLLLLGIFDVAAGVSAHCSSHHYTGVGASNVMQFTKEVVSQEYATLPEYKSLHCCAKGYQSIEWFMNGKPLSHDTSSLIIDPAAENQTIYTYTVAHSDAGNYTCVLRNATHKMEHRIQLHVHHSADAPDSPLPTFRPHDISVGLHQPARLFCEAYVGHVKLPDAHSVVTWSHVFNGEQTPLGDGAHQIIEQREAKQIVGAYLLIPHMKPANYGRYVCRIDIGNAINRLEMGALISGPPTEATNLYWSMTPLQLALVAALLTVGVLVLVRYSIAWYTVWRKREINHCRNGIGGGGGGGGGMNGIGSDGGLLGGRCNSISAASGGGGAPNAEKLMHFRNVV